ncbi:unnamed protein product [Owenia fusiformis]|uniref:Acyltransferase 3 domain-containing protein n=1 Tax=Owenia fusiformis TaxID=6347 RepID=A0A8S4MYZ1_OWEFU|nr:unnamed protein product [Owenia fusiformis]
MERLALTFSAYTNFKKILTGKHAPGSFQCLHGIKVLSMGWLIFANTHFFGLVFAESWTTKNLLPALDRIKLYTFQPILNAYLSADSYFMMAGMILTYSFLHFLNRKRGKWNARKIFTTAVHYIFHRWWRLSMVYWFLMAFYINFQPYSSFGPLNPRMVTDRTNCLTRWWKNILYINNIVRDREGCMQYSWFMACIMQFYCVSPLFLVPLFYFPLVGVSLLALLLAGNLTALGVLNNRLETTYSGNNTNNIAGYNADFNFDINIKPYTRIGPYVVGMLIGFILYRYKCQFPKVRFPKTLNIICWILAIVLCSTVAYGTYSKNMENGTDWTKTQTVAYETLVHLTWSIGLGWICFACITGYGGVANSILSWNAFLPLSRLCYAVHLLHPIAISAFIYDQRDTVIITDAELQMWWLSHVGYSLGTGFLTAILVEWPTRELEKEIPLQWRVWRKPDSVSLDDMKKS